MLTLIILRAALAILIALSLTLAPVASAFAAAQPSELHTTMMSVDAGMDMSDCMKAMGTSGSSDKSDCKCCDTKHKCPDGANCMTKCCKVIGALKPAGKLIAVSAVAYRHAEPAKPPNWVSTPPAPPPRS
jgi:hypothetical protein